MQVRFLPGKVELAGRFDVAQRIRLDGVLDKARAELGVPVVFDVVASFEKKRPQAEVGREAAAPQARRRRETLPRRKPMMCRNSG